MQWSVETGELEEQHFVSDQSCHISGVIYRVNILVSTEEAFHVIAPGATEAFCTAS